MNPNMGDEQIRRSLDNLMEGQGQVANIMDQEEPYEAFHEDNEEVESQNPPTLFKKKI